MEMVEYYIKTLTAAGGKLLPVGVFLLVGYFLFIKLPFYFMVKVSKENKKADSDVKDLAVELKIAQQKILQEKLGHAREEKEKQQQKHREEEVKDKKKEETKKAAPAKNASPEEVFEIPAGKVLNKAELKKRYFELLKMNHPDKVAALGNDFKILAEKKTKAINTAYDELKKKAS